MSKYLQYLPPILQEGDFLGRFLLAFEVVLSGKTPAEEPLGIEQLLDRADTFFDPQAARADFPPWLAQWVATSLRDDWSETTKRDFLSQIVPLYRMRGTRAGIEAVLSLSGEVAEVVDFSDGIDEGLEAQEFGPGAKPPHFFGVVVTVNSRDPILLARTVRRVRAIVDREKPAHTFYGLRVRSPAMRINNGPLTADDPGIFVGVTTGLGTNNVQL